MSHSTQGTRKQIHNPAEKIRYGSVRQDFQSAAVNAAVNAFNKELLASHIRNCVARDIRRGKDETIDELVATLQKLMK